MEYLLADTSKAYNSEGLAKQAATFAEPTFFPGTLTKTDHVVGDKAVEREYETKGEFGDGDGVPAGGLGQDVYVLDPFGWAGDVHDKYRATSTLDHVKVRDAVPLCLEAKEKEDGASKRYLQSLRSVLNRFAFKCGNLVVNEVRHPQITEFLKGYKISLRTRQGYLTDLRTFFSWCEQKGHCEVNPCVAAMPSKAKRKQIMEAKRGRRKLQVLTPGEVKKLLTYCETEEPTLTPYACLCVFGGLRPEREAPNMIDEDITAAGHGPFKVEVDLMQPLDPDKKPRVHEPPLNHVGLWVDNLEAAVSWLSDNGVRFTPGGIRTGASGYDVCFIHPKGNDETPVSGEGVLIELVQAPADVIDALG